MKEIINFMFSDFFIWVGFMIIIYIITNAFVVLLNNDMRAITIWFRGYLPSHYNLFNGDENKLSDDDENKQEE